ncbi:hypothetical protein BJ684DRAFT_4578, partial [Piptocephalis cylindrospora]
LDQAVNTQLMERILPLLTQFHTRNILSSQGALSGKWIAGVLQSILNASPASMKSRVKLQRMDHPWDQPSFIVRVEASVKSESSSNPAVILGAHYDSVNIKDPRSGRAPGADDNGSGVVVLMEALRCVMLANTPLKHPIEFHWYSGEEAGLLGSQAVVRSYVKGHKKVAGALMMDMVAFPQGKGSNPVIGVANDNTNPQLSQFVRSLVKTYTDAIPKDFQCGYACSDNYPWFRKNFPTSLVFESNDMEVNKVLHTQEDSLENIDYNHAKRFARLAVAFALELA